MYEIGVAFLLGMVAGSRVYRRYYLDADVTKLSASVKYAHEVCKEQQGIIAVMQGKLGRIEAEAQNMVAGYRLMEEGRRLDQQIILEAIEREAQAKYILVNILREHGYSDDEVDAVLKKLEKK